MDGWMADDSYVPELFPSAWPVEDPSKDHEGKSAALMEVMGFGMHLVFDLISLNIIPFSGLPSLPSYQMYSALCVSAFTRTMTERPCVGGFAQWTDVRTGVASDHRRNRPVISIESQMFVPDGRPGRCTRPCATQKKPESRDLRMFVVSRRRDQRT